MKFSIITVVLICMTLSVYAQTKNVSHGNLQWLQYYNQSKISKNWSILADGGYRWRDGFSSGSQYVVRGSLAYHINENVRIAAGLAHLGFYSTENEILKREFRPYQELNIKQKFRKVGFDNRFRLEQRHSQMITTADVGADETFNYRFRYRFRFKLPLFKPFSQKPEQAVSIHLGNEILLNAGNEVIDNIFDQNRLMLGSSYRVSPSLAFSFTYSNTFASRNEPDAFSQSDVFWLGIKHNLDFTKKSS